MANIEAPQEASNDDVASTKILMATFDNIFKTNIFRKVENIECSKEEIYLMVRRLLLIVDQMLNTRTQPADLLPISSILPFITDMDFRISMLFNTTFDAGETISSLILKYSHKNE